MSARERMAAVTAERRIVKVGHMPHAVETLDPEDYAALAEAVNDDYRGMQRAWGEACDELTELRARDAVAYMRAAAETEVRQAEGRMGQAEQEAKALRARVKQLESAILDQGGEWATSDVADTGAPELSIGIRLDPMADIDARLAALDGPAEAGVAGVAATCLGRSPITGLPCDFAPRHAGWCCHALAPGVKVRWS